jgi:hypothetical protein
MEVLNMFDQKGFNRFRIVVVKFVPAKNNLDAYYESENVKSEYVNVREVEDEDYNILTTKNNFLLYQPIEPEDEKLKIYRVVYIYIVGDYSYVSAYKQSLYNDPEYVSVRLAKPSDKKALKPEDNFLLTKIYRDLKKFMDIQQ